MLSGKLIHMVESHWDPITASALHEIHRDRLLAHIAGLPDAELREWSREILHNLGEWMTQDRREELAARYENLGKLRYVEEVPLAEAVAGLCALKQKIFEFVTGHAHAQNSTEIYAEEEFAMALGRFFDFLTCSLVRGYEAALRRDARLSAPVATAARHAHA